MVVGGEDLAVVLHGLRLVAGFFVGLRQQDQDEGIALVGLLQVGDGGLGVAEIEGDVSLKVGEERRLLRVGALVEDGLGGGDVLLGVGALAAAGGDAGLGVLPAEVPQVNARRA